MIVPSSARGDQEVLWQGLGLDDERVVAGRLEALLDPSVDALTVVQDLRRLAVYGLAAHYLGPAFDRLVAQADAEDRDLAGDLR